MTTKPAGDFDQIVTLRRRSTVAPGGAVSVTPMGHAAAPWVVIASDVFARVRERAVTETIDGAAAQSMETTEFTIRYRPSIDHTCSVLWRGKHYDVIGAVLHDTGALQDLKLTAIAGHEDHPT